MSFLQWLRLCIVLAPLSCVAYVYAEEKINLQLLESVLIESDWLMMSDLVDLELLSDDSAVAFLENIVVARSPMVSASRLLSREQLSKRLENYPYIELNGADEVKVSRKSHLVKAERIQQEIRNAIFLKLSEKQISVEQFRVTGLERIHDLRVPFSDQIEVIVDRFQPELPTASFFVWIDIVSGNNRIQSMKLPVKLEINHPVWTVTRDMDIGDLITAEDVTARIVDNSEFEYLSAFEEVIGFEVQTKLLKGVPLPNDSLRVASDFSRGETMIAKLHSGVVNLQVPVKLLSPANSGDTIVAQRENGRKVSVLIEADGTALIIGKYSDEN